ncbi:SusC/RagA family TonB-linked outer membrane protein [Mucilaginibacter daejeonensis]|uniref:SusC/RagA family TonB-linked outer membrane protein n=1 Tax=Mucilaginibacter daejeonensis TaxID=398049 RepID=UPI001D17574D|nr:SusC/RagA family TonB-linked outer membrane protein [Mucilaginibacter daejeonensis]UEG51912.1 SusC/RagA family TonB-linked outer membrane protein [Mucilaginibacter daejeonensis]
MKITFGQLLIITLMTGITYSKPTSAQEVLNKKITLSVQQRTLADVLKTLARTHKVEFIYNQDVVSTSDKITAQFSNMGLKDVLNQLLTQYHINYQVFKDKIILIDAQPQSQAVTNAKEMQAINITGKVVDEKDQPLVGVSVTVKGTSKGTITDVNGGFKLSVESTNDVLVFKYVGYNTLEVPATGTLPLTIKLTADSKSLNEVVVVGYGTKKKSDLTGSVASLSSEDIVKSRAPNAQEALQGRMPGVDVKRSSGKPGADMTIEIRGVNSIYGNTQPLYVVDGIPVANINDINPADIERMDVLKDASSTAIFGSRGANGVVIVTTKRGTRGQTKVNYDGYVGFVNAYNLPKVMDGPKFVDYAREFYRTLGTNVTPNVNYTDAQIFSATELANIANGNYTNWINVIKRNGLQTNHNLSVTGGDEKTLYFLSAGYQQYEGALKVENTKKYTLKVGLEKTLGSVVKIGASMYGTYADFNLGSGEVFRSAYRLRPTGSAYNADGSPRFFAYEGEQQITNPLFDFDNDLRRTQYIRMLPNLFAELSFGKDLKFRTSFTPDITFQRAGTYSDTYSKIGAGTKPNAATNGANHIFNYTLDNLLIYNKSINTDNKLELTLGNSLNYYQTDNNLISVSGLPYRSLWYNVGNVTTVNGVAPVTTVSSAYSKQTISSYFFRGNYTLKGRYLLTVTGRADGNSIFSDGNKWGFFPSAALGWVASEENFIKNISAISFLKFRFSYGRSGNAAVNGTYFYPYVTQSAVSTSYYDFNGANANGSGIVNLAPSALTWEKTTEYNAGMELNLFKNRVAFTFDYYNKTAKGTLLPQQIPAANGYATITANVGSIRNSGVELGLNTTNIKSKDFTWTTNINFSKNNNKIIDLFGNGANDVGNARFIGEKARVLYNYKIIGVWQSNEAAQAATFGQKPGQYKLLDVNGDGRINADDRVIQGSDIPDWFGGLTSTFNYKNFDLGITFYTRQGTKQVSTFLEQAMNGDQGRARFGAYDRSYWTTTNPSNTWANNAIETDATRRLVATYQNSSYTKISNMTLGFTAPKALASKIGMNSLRIYTTAYNPFIWTKFIGWDPETADLNSFGLQDFRTRTFILGVNLTL